MDVRHKMWKIQNRYTGKFCWWKSDIESIGYKINIQVPIRLRALLVVATRTWKRRNRLVPEGNKGKKQVPNKTEALNRRFVASQGVLQKKETLGLSWARAQTRTHLVARIMEAGANEGLLTHYGELPANKKRNSWTDHTWKKNKPGSVPPAWGDSVGTPRVRFEAHLKEQTNEPKRKQTNK